MKSRGQWRIDGEWAGDFVFRILNSFIINSPACKLMMDYIDQNRYKWLARPKFLYCNIHGGFFAEANNKD
jgi:hypothetical protein